MPNTRKTRRKQYTAPEENTAKEVIHADSDGKINHFKFSPKPVITIKRLFIQPLLYIQWSCMTPGCQELYS